MVTGLCEGTILWPMLQSGGGTESARPLEVGCRLGPDGASYDRIQDPDADLKSVKGLRLGCC